MAHRPPAMVGGTIKRRFWRKNASPARGGAKMFNFFSERIYDYGK